MNEKLKTPEMDQLFRAVLKLGTTEECCAFFDDLCTVSELQAMAQRLDVARLLEDGNTYGRIGELTGASTTTVSRVTKALHYGSDGYKTILERLKPIYNFKAGQE